MLSNATTTIDSVTKFQDYIDKAKECDMKALAISEHGNIMEWWHKKCAIEKAGMKYIHACEVYITTSLKEKFRDNYHCLLIAKNKEGFHELNRLVSRSYNKNDGHFYYNPRITYDELKNTSDNIIVSTACVGGIMNKGEDTLQNDFLLWLYKNKHRCFLEIQHHQTAVQVEYNKKLIDLSIRYGIPLLATTDTHCLNEKHVRGRSILQKAKNIYFDDEEGWDLYFRTYDELCDAFQRQGIAEEIYKIALNNTNKIADIIEPFELTKETKYPKIYDNPLQTFKDKINKGFKDNQYIKQRYSFEEVEKRLYEELAVYEKTGSIDFMLMQAYLREWEKENGVQCGYARGSASGSMIAYLLNITQMDSLKFNLNFFRFMNPDRVSNADIDTDYSERDREKVKRFLLKDHMNIDNIQCSEIITFNTIAVKGAIKDVARAMDIPLDKAQHISNQIINDEIPNDLRQQYPELFEYVDIVNGVVMSIGSHPSGVLVTDRDINSEIGTCTLSTSDYPVSMLNMKELDDLMYVKLDLLGLDNIGIINDTCKMIGLDRFNPDNINLNDEEVWKSIRDDTTLIFQWESESSAKYLKKFMSDSTIGKVRNTIPDFSYIKWFSFGNGLIRPACASYRDEVANGKFSTTGLKELDEFLAPTLGRITMQEDIMRFLVKFCGYSQAESDTVRRGIAKKKGTEQLLPEIERRFVEYVNAEFGVDKVKAQEVIKPFIQTILDASSYAFSWNHSDAYSCIGYISGYLRYYYPLEFLTASFNTFSDKLDKTQKVTDYAKKHNIKIKAPKFGYAHNEYMCDKESNTIYKGLGSIKDMQSIAADIMLDIADKNPETFVDVLFLTEECKIDNKKINKKSLDILLNIGFFDVFGTIPELKSILHWFDKYKKCKTVKRETLTDEWLIEIIRKNAGKKSEKQFREIDNKGIVKDIYNILPKQAENNTALIRNQIKHLGYADVGNDNISPLEYYVQDVNEDKWGRIWLSLYQLSSGISKRYKCDKTWFKRLPCIKDDIIKAIFKSKEKMKVVGEDEDGKKIFARTGEYENIVKGYSIVK
jgi:DNA polymerase-3 subunit alpha